MGRAMLACAVALAAAPSAAGEPDGLREGAELLSRGARLLLEGLVGELEPALGGIGEALRGLDAYHPPEILPNGDIVIRRRVPLPAPESPGDGGIAL